MSQEQSELAIVRRDITVLILELNSLRRVVKTNMSTIGLHQDSELVPCPAGTFKNTPDAKAEPQCQAYPADYYCTKDCSKHTYSIQKHWALS